MHLHHVCRAHESCHNVCLQAKHCTVPVAQATSSVHVCLHSQRVMSKCLCRLLLTQRMCLSAGQPSYAEVSVRVCRAKEPCHTCLCMSAVSLHAVPVRVLQANPIQQRRSVCACLQSKGVWVYDHVMPLELSLTYLHLALLTQAPYGTPSLVPGRYAGHLFDNTVFDHVYQRCRESSSCCAG